MQRKPPFFDASSNALLGSKCNLVASASCYGIVFVGSSNAELLVACLKDLETEAPLDADQSIPIRKVPLPAQTTQIATNCDGSILAVASKLNGTPHIQLYSVASFLTPVGCLMFCKTSSHVLIFRMYKSSASSVYQLTTLTRFNSAGIP